MVLLRVAEPNAALSQEEEGIQRSVVQMRWDGGEECQCRCFVYKHTTIVHKPTLGHFGDEMKWRCNSVMVVRGPVVGTARPLYTLSLKKLAHTILVYLL
jgi:hypothetical protein